MTAEIVDGRKIASKIRENIKEEVEKLFDKYGKKPNVTSIIIGDDPSSRLYLKLRDKACNEVGIVTNHIELPNNVTEEKVLNTISGLNNDKDVNGILIQFPIPSHISQDKITRCLDPGKDIEGFHPYNMGQTLLGIENIVPCTPLAVITILEYEKINPKGLDVTIVNHSNVVGKPLASMFLNRNATVNVCHVFSKDVKKYTKQADILVSATGKPGLIKEDFVKKDAFVIDVGIVKTKDGITGDVDFNSVKNIAGKITPVPGGVGPVTVACSLVNMVKTFKNSIEK